VAKQSYTNVNRHSETYPRAEEDLRQGWLRMAIGWAQANYARPRRVVKRMLAKQRFRGKRAIFPTLTSPRSTGATCHYGA
jgi:hypothetical protein